MAGIAADGGQARRARQPSASGSALFQRLTQNLGWELFILACIIANAAILGIDAHLGQGNRYAADIELWNSYFLYIFTAELALEFLAQGPRRYFRNGWNIFDAAVVGVSYIAAAPATSALRALRVVRVFRLISAVPQMRRAL